MTSSSEHKFSGQLLGSTEIVSSAVIGGEFSVKIHFIEQSCLLSWGGDSSPLPLMRVGIEVLLLFRTFIIFQRFLLHGCSRVKNLFFDEHNREATLFRHTSACG